MGILSGLPFLNSNGKEERGGRGPGEGVRILGESGRVTQNPQRLTGKKNRDQSPGPA